MPPASDARLEPGGRRPSKQGGRRPSKLLSLFSFSFAKRRKHSTAEADAATLSKALGGSEREGTQLKNASGSSGGSARPLHPAEELEEARKQLIEKSEQLLAKDAFRQQLEQALRQAQTERQALHGEVRLLRHVTSELQGRAEQDRSRIEEAEHQRSDASRLVQEAEQRAQDAMRRCREAEQACFEAQ